MSINQTKINEIRTVKNKLLELYGKVGTLASADSRNNLQKSIVDTKNKLQKLRIDNNVVGKEPRKQLLEFTQPLRDIFLSFWATFLPYTEHGCLTKEGYVKFSEAMMISLMHAHHYGNLEVIAEGEWENDKQLFGNLDQDGFSDMLMETLGKTISHIAINLVLISDCCN
jgi:hypothetical protein